MGHFYENSKYLEGYGDKSFLKWVKFLGYWPISFKGYGLPFNLLKVIWDTSDPRVFPALNLMKI